MTTPTTPTTIRTSTIAILTSALPGIVAGDWTGYDSRVTDLDDAQLPAVNVETGTADEEDEGGTGSYRRSEELLIEAHFVVSPDGEGNADPEAVLGARCDLIERGIKDALFGNPAWRNQFEHVTRIRTSKGRDAASDHYRGRVLIAMSVQYSEGYGYEPVEDETLDAVDFETKDHVVTGTIDLTEGA